MEKNDLVPSKTDLFVEFGKFDILKKIIESREFCPVYIHGPSGNGKTHSVEQACAQLGRDLIRLNITTETDEDDLLGGFRLVNGDMKWFDGPVTRAMKNGSILLLDEVDCGSTKMMAIQAVLEGYGAFLKKINTFVSPAPGFNVIATANTKGQGDITGKYIGTAPMNEAQLERFPVTIEQNYPPEETERKILDKLFDSFKLDVSLIGNFTENLVKWANQTRESYAKIEDGDVITTRRLVHICKVFNLLRDKRSSIEMCISRFSTASKEALMALYLSIDPSLNPEELNAMDSSGDENTFTIDFVSKD